MGRRGAVGGQRLLKTESLQQCRRHALPVHRVEAAHRIADDQQTLRERGQLVVATPHAGRKLSVVCLPDRFCGRECGADLRRDTCRHCCQHLGQPGRQLVSGHADQRHDHCVVLVGEHPDACRSFLRRADEDHPVAQGVRRQAEELAGIGQSHPIRLLDRTRKAMRCKERRCTCRTTGCVDHEIGGQYRLMRAGAVDDTNSGHRAVVQHGSDDVVAVEDLDIRQCTNPFAHNGFQQWTARRLNRHVIGLGERPRST